MKHFTDGKKTYAGIIILALGALGASQYISAAEVAETYDLLLKLAGIVIAVYGRAVSKG